MIIKFTINDNDFHTVMFGFLKNMWNVNLSNKAVKDMSEKEIDAMVDCIFEHEKIMQLVNPNYDKELTNEETETLIAFLHKRFAEYVEIFIRTNQAREYLKRHLKITIQKTFTDKWENGEAFYWLQHSNVIVNQ